MLIVDSGLSLFSSQHRNLDYQLFLEAPYKTSKLLPHFFHFQQFRSSAHTASFSLLVLSVTRMDHTSLPPTPESFDIQDKVLASPNSSVHWESVAARRRYEILNKIPQAYLISQEEIEKAGINATRTSGVLTAREQEIVEKSATALLELLHSRQYSSVEVTTAFCKSSALAHQLVCFSLIPLY